MAFASPFLLVFLPAVEKEVHLKVENKINCFLLLHSINSKGSTANINSSHSNSLNSF